MALAVESRGYLGEYSVAASTLRQPVISGDGSLCGRNDWVKVLRPTQQKTGHFGDVLSGQCLGVVLKKLSLTQQKQTTQEQKLKHKNAQNAKPKQTATN